MRKMDLTIKTPVGEFSGTLRATKTQKVFIGERDGIRLRVQAGTTKEGEDVSLVSISGNTYPIKEQLKALGFKWDGEGWYYEGVHPEFSLGGENDRENF